MILLFSNFMNCDSDVERKLCSTKSLKRVPAIFSNGNVTALGFIIRHMTHFDGSFLYRSKLSLFFFFCIWLSSCFTCIWKDCLFFTETSLRNLLSLTEFYSSSKMFWLFQILDHSMSFRISLSVSTEEPAQFWLRLHWICRSTGEKQ